MPKNQSMFCRRGARRGPASHWSPSRRVGARIAIGLCVLLIAGCARKNPARPSTPEVNSDLPNANARIVSQQIFGAADKLSDIWWLRSADGLSNYFVGRYDSKVGVGSLDAAGKLKWHVESNSIDVEALSLASPMPGAAISVGGLDVDGDKENETGHATLFTSAGAIASQVLFASDTSDVWLVSIAPLSDSEFVAVGGERTASRLNPLVARLVVTVAGTLEKRQQIVIGSISGRYAVDVATDPADASGPDRRIYLSTRVGVGTNTITLHGVDLAVPALAPWSVAWSQTLPGKGLGTTEFDMRVFGGALYVAGEAKDPDKTTGSSTGGYWSSGLVARLSREGVAEWAKVVSATGHSECFHAIEPTASSVVAVGDAARYFTSDASFGYGWVARFSPAAGEVQSNLTFGDPGYNSGFWCGRVVGGTVLAGGWTQRETEGGGSRAWLCNLNLNASASPPAAVASAPVREGEAAVPVDLRRDVGR